MTINVCEWDSRFFGYPVAALTLEPSNAHLERIHAAIQDATRTGIRLLYLFLPIPDHTLREPLEKWGFLSVGQKVEFAQPVAPPPQPNADPDISLCQTPGDALKQLALASGQHSRFRLDPGFRNREFERLYEEWLFSSLRGDNNKRVFVAGDSAAPVGLLTLEPGRDAARIGLFATHAAHRGKGFGRRLLHEARRYCAQRQIPELRVATQAANTNACGWYQAAGFQNVSTVDIFHLWLPPTSNANNKL